MKVMPMNTINRVLLYIITLCVVFSFMGCPESLIKKTEFDKGYLFSHVPNENIKPGVIFHVPKGTKVEDYSAMIISVNLNNLYKLNITSGGCNFKERNYFVKTNFEVTGNSILKFIGISGKYSSKTNEELSLKFPSSLTCSYIDDFGLISIKKDTNIINSFQVLFNSYKEDDFYLVREIVATNSLEYGVNTSSNLLDTIDAKLHNYGAVNQNFNYDRKQDYQMKFTDVNPTTVFYKVERWALQEELTGHPSIISEKVSRER